MGSIGTKQDPNRPLTEAEMESSMASEFELINKGIEKFLKGRYSTLDEAMDDYKAGTPEDERDEMMLGQAEHIERYTLGEIKSNYLKDFNSNVEHFGDGFQFWDNDEVWVLHYSDGTGIYVSPDEWDGTKKIPLTGLDSAIIEGGWGTGIAGKNIELQNYRETVGYGKYGYSDVKKRYEDFNDIRADFRTQPTRWRKK